MDQTIFLGGVRSAMYQTRDLKAEGRMPKAGFRTFGLRRSAFAFPASSNPDYPNHKYSSTPQLFRLVHFYRAFIIPKNGKAALCTAAFL